MRTNHVSTVLIKLINEKVKNGNKKVESVFK